MPYLGPKSFETAPLTSNNLKYLTDKLIESNPSNNLLLNDSISPIDSTKDDKLITKKDKILNNNINNNNNNIDIKIPDSSISSISSYFSSPDESILTPLSTVSSNSDDIIDDNRTSIINDNETVIINDQQQQQPSQSIEKSSSSRTITPQFTFKNGLNSESSASISTIIQPNTNNNNNNTNEQLPHPLLRKKSGELVKSSLKLPSLKRSNSMPNTNKFNSNNRNKSVRFAAILEDVKFFNKLEKPTAVSAENSPIQSPMRTSWDLTSDSSDLDDEFDDDSDNNNNNNNNNDDKKNHWSIIKNDSPSTDSFDFLKFKSDKPIILDCVKLGSNKDSIVGFVFVKNLSYQKKIIIRLTIDNWNSFIELDNTNYISSNHIFNYNKLSNSSLSTNGNIISSNESYDRFSFIIKLNSLISNYSQSNSIDLKFCLKYEVNNLEYWDNNNNSNYHIILSRKQPISTTSSSRNRSDSFKLDNDYFNFNKLKISDEFDDDDNNFLLSNHHQNLLLDSELNCDLKLKSNNNSKNRYSFDEKSSNNNNNNNNKSITPNQPKLKHSNHYLLKKNLSAPSLATLSSSSLENKQKTLDFNKSQLHSKQPPVNDSNIPKSLNSQMLYNKLIQNYCFFGSEENSPIGSPISNAYLSPNSNKEFIDSPIQSNTTNTGSPVRLTSKMEISPFYLH